jgi:hypothetical protein
MPLFIWRFVYKIMHIYRFIFDRKRAMEICDGMIERKINLPWGCGTRADVVTKEVLAKISRAHCTKPCSV